LADFHALEQAFQDPVPERLLTIIGGLLLAESVLSFRDQRMGSEDWEPRYPNQTDPKVNVAGVVGDLLDSGSIKSRRFDDTPALEDTGALRNSLTASTMSNRAVVGTNLPYAPIQLYGGPSDPLPITPEVKEGLLEFLAENGQYEDKLGYLFYMDELTTDVVGRPFIPTESNFPDALWERIEKATIKYYDELEANPDGGKPQIGLG
jgi:phage gpG-like protein